MLEDEEVSEKADGGLDSYLAADDQEAKNEEIRVGRQLNRCQPVEAKEVSDEGDDREMKVGPNR